MTAQSDSEGIVARHITITGVVQGVGFRPFVYTLATDRRLAGWVLNHSGGVDIEVEGPGTQVAAFVTALGTQAPPLAHVESLVVREIPLSGFTAFEIRHSESQEGRYQLISPDVATCPDCVRELFDPQDRRYRYPFINCTNCGPRFTIIDDIPYDRPNTTMRIFPMCDDCRAEYQNPRDRRFHAQPNACRVCGPHLWMVESANNQEGTVSGEQERHACGGADAAGLDPASRTPYRASGSPLVGEAVFAKAKELLLSGQILAIKGLGGFHLACDATNAETVRRLRARKHRQHKPFAVMATGLEQVKTLCVVTPEAEALLTSPQCPIVLLEKRPDTPIADEVAPNSHTLGIMIPYTPLHHVLLHDVGRPLVMTSGNLSEEPIAKDNDEALRRLAPLADAFILHNRDIHARYDDSVVQLVAVSGQVPATSPQHRASSIQFLRRARGYAPFPIRLPFKIPQVFAAGPLLKNTFTLTRDAYAFISQHIGDLENVETLEHYQAALETYQHLFRLKPEIVASDLHPDYLSTRLAETFASEHGLPAPMRIQHHEAHIAACLADNDRGAEAGPVIGVALDGTGYGEDGQIWGGEWFIGDYRGFERVAHLEYLPLPGGDTAIREPWRIAVAYLHALEVDEQLPLGEFCPGDVMRVRMMVDRKLNTPLTSSMGRLFDAVSALLGVCRTTSYEAQAAIELEQVATPAGAPHAAVAPYAFDIDRAARPQRILVGPLFDGILSDMERGMPVEAIARKFHATIAAMVVEVSRALRTRTGINTVALGGGVFQNRLLLRMATQQLATAGFDVLVSRRVPPNDGAISLGQAVMAAFRAG